MCTLESFKPNVNIHNSTPAVYIHDDAPTYANPNRQLHGNATPPQQRLPPVQTGNTVDVPQQVSNVPPANNDAVNEPPRRSGRAINKPKRLIEVK